jgi:hypothetical protein
MDGLVFCLRAGTNLFRRTTVTLAWPHSDRSIWTIRAFVEELLPKHQIRYEYPNGLLFI